MNPLRRLWHHHFGHSLHSYLVWIPTNEYKCGVKVWRCTCGDETAALVGKWA